MNATFATYWRAMAAGNKTGFIWRLTLGLLIPASLLYVVIQRVRSFCYKNGLLKSSKLPRPTISIGNITVGGTGKTPFTAWLAGELIGRGYRVAVLSRGYGGSLEGTCAIVSDGVTIQLSPQESGDEPYLLARSVPRLIVVIGSDRYSAGCLALERLHPDLFLLDDGFQHLKLQRNLDIVLLDWRNPFGNGHCLPAGLLREPLTALERAGLIIRTRCEQDDGVSMLAGIPCYDSRHQLGEAIPLTTGAATVPLASFVGKSVVAFAGIAEPDRFFKGLREFGINLVGVVTLPDHIRYDNVQIAALENALYKFDTTICLTTEKDGVKLAGWSSSSSLNIYQVSLELVCSRAEHLIDVIENILQK